MKVKLGSHCTLKATPLLLLALLLCCRKIATCSRNSRMHAPGGLSFLMSCLFSGVHVFCACRRVHQGPSSWWCGPLVYINGSFHLSITTHGKLSYSSLGLKKYCTNFLSSFLGIRMLFFFLLISLLVGPEHQVSIHAHGNQENFNTHFTSS